MLFGICDKIFGEIGVVLDYRGGLGCRGEEDKGCLAEVKSSG